MGNFRGTCHFWKSVGAVVTLVLLASVYTQTQSAASLPSEGVYRRAIYSKVLTFDPAQMTDTASLSVTNQIYDGLLEFGNHFEIENALAESWQTSPDGLTITFKLKSNTKFHDGTPVTSADCVRSFERLVAKQSVVSKNYEIILGATEFKEGKTSKVLGLEAPDAHTFIIHLKNKYPPFSAILAGATAKILPRSKVDAPDFFNHPIGTGPFKLASNSDSEIVLVRFDDYWREKAKLKELHFIVADENKGMELAQQGKLDDLVTFPYNGDEPVFSDKNQHRSIPVIATWIIGLNTRHTPFNKKAVRQRFKQALQSSDFIKEVYPGQLDAGGGYIPLGLPGYREKTGKEVKPVKAEIIKDPITVLVPIELSRAPQIKKFIIERTKLAGFTSVAVELVNWEKLMEQYTQKTMQAFLMSMNADYPDTEFLVQTFESNNPDNFSGLKSKKVDALIKKARETEARLDRTKIYQELASVLEEEALTVNLLHYRAHYWLSSCVEGIELNSLGDVYIPYRKISLNGSCQKTKEGVAHAQQ